MATDPICGMYVDEGLASLRLQRENRTYYFCSEGCLLQFAAPEVERRRLRRNLLVAWPLAVAVLALTYIWHPADWPFFAGGLAAVVQFFSGRSFYRGARDAITNRMGNMDLLIAVGTTAAFLYSWAALFAPGRLPAAYYFDASSLIIALILSGHYLEEWTRARASSALQRLNDLLPATVRVLRKDSERTIPLVDLRPGDIARIRPGERFPADAQIRVGRTSVDEAILTGEPFPVPKQPGDSVLAGAINLEGLVDVEALGVGESTFLTRIGQLLTEAETSRVPLQRFADRLAAAFVPFVLALGPIAATLWVLFGAATPEIGLLVFVSVVITACPCAFGLATPAAILVGTGRAAQGGVLFKGADSIERCAHVDLVLTDKTGTLTQTTPALTSVKSLPPFSVEEVVALAAAVERGSDHPLARAVVDAAKERHSHEVTVTDIRVDPGRGIWALWNGRRVGVLQPDGTQLAVGEVTYVNDELTRIRLRGETGSLLTIDGKVAGVLGFHTPVLAGAREAIAELARDGIGVVMVTGDGPEAAQQIAKELGISSVHARVDPVEKTRLVARYQAEGHHVAFVGDGINDAAALAAAEVGIAIGTGSDVTREAGQVLLVRPDFAGVPLALRTARRTVAKVRQNLTWAIAYNAVLLPIAAGLLVPLFGFGVYQILPISGALAMAISSTTVLANSLSLRWIRIDRPEPPRSGIPAPLPARATAA
ncbi:MAG: heavy metal translocating P-type ATPase [Thermoplasmata archaeon]